MSYGIPFTKQPPSVTGWAAGDIRWFPYDDPLNCAQGESAFFAIRTWAGRVAATYATEPELESARDCSGGSVITPPPTPGNIQTNTVRANFNVLTLVTENNGTKWRIRKTSNYGIPSGQQEFIYINGERKASFGGYDYFPGDQISVLYAISTDTNPNNWTTKGYSLIIFGAI
jgi:hypothetical protein